MALHLHVANVAMLYRALLPDEQQVCLVVLWSLRAGLPAL